jgi:plasmid stability protein
MPDDLYQRIQLMANAKNRSLSAQVITLLSQAIELEERRMKQAKVLNSIQRRRFKVPKNTPSSLDLLREDRER